MNNNNLMDASSALWGSLAENYVPLGMAFFSEGELEIYLWNKYREETQKSFQSLGRFRL